MSGTPAKQRRSDAHQNRERILRAAATAFADLGPSASLVEIARRAGVGSATLHRNFTKEQLVDEVFTDWFGGRLAMAKRALADPDPWHGFVTFCEEMLVVEGGHRSTGVLFALRPQWRDQFVALMRELLEQVQSSGDVRADLTVEDLILSLMGPAVTRSITADVAPNQWRRQLQVMLQGMRPPAEPRPLPGFAVPYDQLNQQLSRWSDEVLRS